VSTAAGLVVVDKPAGLTSHDVVARVRRLAATRKVGHAGTLDPMATGVLVVGINRATRLLGHLMLTEKAYDATVRLGVSTHTDDAEGEELSIASPSDLEVVDDAAVRRAVEAFVGDIEQRPSQVSAIKVDGRRSYARVRAGEAVDLPPRPVTVHELLVQEVRPGPGHVDVDIALRVSSGTYVRAIARDLGASLGVGGHLTALRRTAVGPFDLTAAHSLHALADDLALIDLSEVAGRCFPGVHLDDDQARDVRVGRRLVLALPPSPAGGPVALFDPAGDFLALYEQRGEVAAPVAVFV
jgi:tRNA pseudouridine55 synthase